jgi:hypothetical protein
MALKGIFLFKRNQVTDTGENFENPTFVFSTKCYSDDQTKVNDIGLACTAHVGDEKCIQNFFGKAKATDNCEDLDGGEMIILK